MVRTVHCPYMTVMTGTIVPVITVFKKLPFSRNKKWGKICIFTKIDVPLYGNHAILEVISKEILNVANDIETMAIRREIRNSTAEFLIFQAEAKEQGVEVYYKDENIWATQKAMATLFDVNVPAISKHLKNIFESGELKDDSVVSKMEITASDGKHYQTLFYSLDAIIAVGYRVNSVRATQFRQWATSVLRE